MDTEHGRSRVAWGTAGLWASAFVLAGLILVQASGTLDGRATAQIVGGMVVRGDQTTALTVDVGNFDALFVIDDRTQRLAAYSTDRQKGMAQRFTVDLPSLFRAARAQWGGR